MAFPWFCLGILGIINNILIINFFCFLAELGLHCCSWAVSSCGKQGPHFAVVRGPPIAVALLAAEHGL